MSKRTGGQILVDQLKLHGTSHVFCVPGESYLAVLDALHDASVDVMVCRQEGGAAIMAEAAGKLTGRPGICFVTRGPGATNAAAGIHIARQDSTPMILFVGQIARSMRGREAFQEVDYRRTFGDESGGATPDITAVAVSADADNTHGSGLSYFTDLSLNAAPALRAKAAPPTGTAE